MNVQKIKDFHDPALDLYARTKEAQLKHRPFFEQGLFIAESPIVIERAIAAGYEPVSFLMEEDGKEVEQKLASRFTDVPVYTAPFDVLTKITGFSLTRGMLSAMVRKELPSVDAVLAHAMRVAVLEDVVNPTNVGAIFRSAAALGMDAVLLTKDSADPLYRRSIRVSMGTVFQIPWTFLPKQRGEEQSLSLLKEQGFKIAAMALCDDSISIKEERLKQEEKLAIVLGTEGEGLKPETIRQADYTVKLPMAYGVDSLNVAAASAVAFWELSKG